MNSYIFAAALIGTILAIVSGFSLLFMATDSYNKVPVWKYVVAWIITVAVAIVSVGTLVEHNRQEERREQQEFEERFSR